MSVTLNLSAKAVIDLTNLAVVSGTALDPHGTGFAAVMTTALSAVPDDRHLLDNGVTITLTDKQATSLLLGLTAQLAIVYKLGIVDTVRYIAEECRRQAMGDQG